MKKFYLFPLLALVLTSCGSKTDSSKNTDSVVYNMEERNDIMELPGGSNDYDVNVDGKNYKVCIKCVSDHELPIVTDQMDQKFYDNRVEVRILRDGTEIINKDFQKDDFVSHLNGVDMNCVMLQGMGFAEYAEGVFILGASVGDPGCEEGSSNFNVRISATGGVTINEDHNQN